MNTDKPLFICAYDTESPGRCRTACTRIFPLHLERGIPATIFLVSSLLDGDDGNFYRKELQSDLFEVGSHTVSHMILRAHPLMGNRKVPDAATRWHELDQSRKTIEDQLGKEVTGFRTPYGFTDGLGTDPAFLQQVAEAGYRYSSSQAWGPDFSLPAPVAPPRTYAIRDFDDMWEFPAFGWHENVLKGRLAEPARLLLFPNPYPPEIIKGPVTTPEEEFEVHRYFVDRAIEEGSEYINIVMHPWSLGAFDPDCRMLQLLFDYAEERGCAFGTFGDLYARKSKRKAVAP